AGRLDPTSAVVVHRQTMAEHRIPQVSDTTAGDGTRTYTSDQPGARDHYAPDARAASIQESGLRENCTSRLSERTEAGRKLHLLRLYKHEAGFFPRGRVDKYQQ